MLREVYQQAHKRNEYDTPDDFLSMLGVPAEVLPFETLFIRQPREVVHQEMPALQLLILRVVVVDEGGAEHLANACCRVVGHMAQKIVEFEQAAIHHDMLLDNISPSKLMTQTAAHNL